MEKFNRPTPAQMRQLAIAGIETEEWADNRLRLTDRTITRDSVSNITEHEGQMLGTNHHIGVRLGRIAVGFQEKAWQLLHVESHKVSRLDGTVKMASTVSEFEWNERIGVYVAKRSLRVSGDGVADLVFNRKDEDLKDQFDINEFEKDYENITRDECDDLIEATRLQRERAARSKIDTSS